MVTNNSNLYPLYKNYTRDDREDTGKNTSLLGGELWYE